MNNLLSLSPQNMAHSQALTPSGFELFADVPIDGIRVFSQPWFVDVLYRENLRIAKAFNKAGELICVFPYGQKNVMGIFPRAACLNGWGRLNSFIFLDKRLSDEERRSAVADIIKQLPRTMGFCQFVLDDESHVIRDVFIEAGFQCIKMPRYIRSPSKQNYFGLNDKDAYIRAKDIVLKSLSKDGRTRYNKTRELVEIEQISPSEFCSFYEENIARKGLKSYSKLSIAEELIDQGIRRQKAFVIAAKGRECIEAATAFMFDSNTIYAWLASRKHYPRGTKFLNESKYKKYCLDVLVIEAMIFAEQHGLFYDAEIIPINKDGIPYSPHKIFVNEKILHLTKKDSRFVFERRGYGYKGAIQLYYKIRKAGKRMIDTIPGLSTSPLPDGSAS